ncbi:toprim domain-containing protein [Actinoplanes sp. NPDC051470]|uniref:toprim domain-containing protein n=1 Tax=Actinoplanes sp. NPDC051470 TaxID=3157224 RepID=UPI0034489C34
MNDPVAAAAVEYLTRVRGLSKDSVQSFLLGYVANPLAGHEQYAGKIAIPYYTRSGFISMRFRLLPEMVDGEPRPAEGPKYLSAPGDMPRLFNPEDLNRREPFVCICEGEMDAITANQAGLPAIGIAGVNGWREYFARCFKGYNAVYVLCDNDDKGQGASFGEKVAAQIQNSRVVLMPSGHDVNSFVKSEGPEALRARLEDSQ